MTVQPFVVDVPQTILDDLRVRLARTRWTDEVTDAGWEYGTNRDYLRTLIDYWLNGFDWRAQEKAINQFAHFRAPVEGLNLHFIHERGKGNSPIPLIITHGWPSSFYQMLKIVPLLTDPAGHGGDVHDAFDVIVPSLPGYGFSDRPAEKGMTSFQMAELLATLMTQILGYDRFGAQAGDIGGSVTRALAQAHPEALIGMHLTDVGWSFDGDSLPNPSEAERTFFQDLQTWGMQEGAYAAVQGTRPQTLAYGLNDSPVGLAAWIVEKFRAWSDCNGDVETRFTRDELLTHLTIYWATETINASTRVYYEDQHQPPPFNPGERGTVPTAVALFPRDITHPPRELAERFFDLRRWTPLPRGGHFAAWEEPDLLAQDIRAFFRPLRSSSGSPP